MYNFFMIALLLPGIPFANKGSKDKRFKTAKSIGIIFWSFFVVLGMVGVVFFILNLINK
jgi:hypothetical protein